MSDELLAFAAIGSTAIAAFSLMFSIKQYSRSKKDENNVHVSNLVEKFQNDLERIQDKNLKLSNTEECRHYEFFSTPHKWFNRIGKIYLDK